MNLKNILLVVLSGLFVFQANFSIARDVNDSQKPKPRTPTGFMLIDYNKTKVTYFLNKWFGEGDFSQKIVNEYKSFVLEYISFVTSVAEKEQKNKNSDEIKNLIGRLKQLGETVRNVETDKTMNSVNELTNLANSAAKAIYEVKAVNKLLLKSKQ